MARYTEFYEYMGVSTTASSSEIQKAYYKMALKCHPDRHPNDATKKATFQKLNNIYSVLSNPSKRRDYDQFGEVDDDEDDGGWGDSEVPFDETHILFTVEELEQLLQGAEVLTPAQLKEVMNFQAKQSSASVYSNEIMEDIIQKAADVKLVELAMSRRQITSVPPSLSTLLHLVHLNLSNNKLEEFPEPIKSLVSLRELILSVNKLTSFPVMPKLQNLKKLELEHNQIESIPASVSTLASLTSLNCFANKLVSVDVALLQLNLTKLDISLNYIKSLDPAFKNLKIESFTMDPTVKFRAALKGVSSKRTRASPKGDPASTRTSKRRRTKKK